LVELGHAVAAFAQFDDLPSSENRPQKGQIGEIRIVRVDGLKGLCLRLDLSDPAGGGLARRRGLRGLRRRRTAPTSATDGRYERRDQKSKPEDSI
jgi:hypothetical protein